MKDPIKKLAKIFSKAEAATSRKKALKQLKKAEKFHTKYPHIDK